MRETLLLLSIVALGTLAGCGRSSSSAVTDTSNAATAGNVPPPAVNADLDRQAGGSGPPKGFVARTDNPSAPITGAKYTRSDGMWEVTTGPAHILYRPDDAVMGLYTVSGTIDQLEKPTHPEAFGIFFGGKDLDKPTQTYTYFLVRGTGELMVKVREGDKTRDVLKWTASADVPKQDAAGKASYSLGAQVTGDAVRFMVNGKQVASVSKVGLPTEGIAGLRVNHNLHVKVSPVAMTHP
jgi:predicted small lipoprotein YifL